MSRPQPPPRLRNASDLRPPHCTSCRCGPEGRGSGAEIAGARTSELATTTAKCVEVEPPNTPPETRTFGGDYIVRSYGSHTTNGVDAIQLEFGGSFRTDVKKREETARWLAEAIKTYTEKYLTPVK